MTDLVSQRLTQLRKHLGERLGIEMTLYDLRDKTGIADYKLQRFENGLKGNTETLVTLLNFYRSHNYNLDWILTFDNTEIPMVIPTVQESVLLSLELTRFSSTLKQHFTIFDEKLRNMGYPIHLAPDCSDPSESASETS